MKNGYRLLVVFVIAASLAACGGGKTPEPTPVTVGSTQATEDQLVAEMYADLLEANGIKVQRKLDLSDSQAATTALTAGEIDLYPEYTGTAYLYMMGMKDGEKDPKMIYEKVFKYYERRWKITWLDPAPVNATNAIAVSPQVAQTYGLKKLSDLPKAAAQLRLAVSPDFQRRPDGLAGLKQMYGNLEFKNLTVLDPAQLYKAIQSGQVDAVSASSTDGQVKQLKLELLQDDKGLWPSYQITPVVRDDTLSKNQNIKDILNKLSPLLTADVMSELNWRVVGENQDYATVAKDFLKQNNLVK